MVHPAAAGPASTNIEITINTVDTKNNQYATIFRNPEAMSLAPSCNGINRLLNVPLNPAVKTKKTIMVPCIVTKAKYMSASITPSGAHFPSKKSKIIFGCSGHAICIRINIDIKIPIIPMKNTPVNKYCLAIIL